MIKMINYKMGHGTCYGIHALYSLAYVLRVDEISPILSNTVRSSALLKLKEAVTMLERSQYGSGLWAYDWHQSAPAGRMNAKHPDLSMKNLLRASGHHLEWLAIAPKELAIPQLCIDAAFHGIAGSICRMNSGN